MTSLPRCPICSAPLAEDPAYPRALRPGPAVWCPGRLREVGHGLVRSAFWPYHPIGQAAT